jgi:hypothetical protein
MEGRTGYYTVLLLAAATFYVAVPFLGAPLARSEAPSPAPGLVTAPYEDRIGELPVRAAQGFVDDPNREITTTLDGKPYDQLNELDCAKPIDNSSGWSVEFRIGGRPFTCFDEIEINGAPWEMDTSLYTPGNSSIDQCTICYHLARKGVNRFWFVHRTNTRARYATVVVMTADGMLNACGAYDDMQQGSAVRLGFIGEPWHSEQDYQQHVDKVSLQVIDDDTLIVTYNVHSEAGEGVLEATLKWIPDSQTPEVHIRSAHAVRSTLAPEPLLIGFAGLDFMKGPTLWGKAFHDGLSAFVEDPVLGVARNLLVPPLRAHAVVREDLAPQVSPGARLILDQPQGAPGYFGKILTPAYDARADFELVYDGGTAEPVRARRAQKAVLLDDVNPEANETVNLFYAAEMGVGAVHEFSTTLKVVAEDAELRNAPTGRQVVYVGWDSPTGNRLYSLALDADLRPAGEATPLTDAVIADPRRPSAYTDPQRSTAHAERYVLFDADDYVGGGQHDARQRVYVYDLWRGTLRKLSDGGEGEQICATANGAGTGLAWIVRGDEGDSLRVGRMLPGFGERTVVLGGRVGSADWSPTRDEIAYTVVADGRAHLRMIHARSLDLITTALTLTAEVGLRDARFSPDGEVIAYVTDAGVFLAPRESDGAGAALVLAGDNWRWPTWVDGSHIVLHRRLGGTRCELCLFDRASGSVSSLVEYVCPVGSAVFLPMVVHGGS